MYYGFAVIVKPDSLLRIQPPWHEMSALHRYCQPDEFHPVAYEVSISNTCNNFNVFSGPGACSLFDGYFNSILINPIFPLVGGYRTGKSINPEFFKTAFLWLKVSKLNFP